MLPLLTVKSIIHDNADVTPYYIYPKIYFQLSLQTKYIVKTVL